MKVLKECFLLLVVLLCCSVTSAQDFNLGNTNCNIYSALDKQDTANGKNNLKPHSNIYHNIDTKSHRYSVIGDMKRGTFITNPEIIKASTDIMFSAFYHFGKIFDESYHNDLGYPTIMLWTDSRGIDLVSENIGYNWFSMAVKFYDTNYSDYGTRLIWSTIYNHLDIANSIIAMVDKNTNDKEIQFYLAQAYAIRAFNYFTIAQLYQHTYVGNEDKPCVPIITEANANSADSEGCPRATVKEVYAQIMSDLDNAITILGNSSVAREDKRYISLDVAYGIRARVNLVMNNWEAAASDAKNAIKNSAAKPYSMNEICKPGFSNIEDASWMWGIVVAETDRPVTSGICNFPSHMGSLNYGYASVGAWRCINKELFASIPASDVRRGWWLDEDCMSMNLTAEQADYVINHAGCPPYTQMKFGCYKDETYTSTNANDIPLMRIEEMYLIQAEAEAMAGDAAAGAATLENLIKTYRNPNYTCAATEAIGVQEAVWNQRRIELWGEGFSYGDLMRLKKGIDRRGAGFAEKLTYNFPANHPALILPIPKNIIQSNPLIGENNPTAMPYIRPSYYFEGKGATITLKEQEQRSEIEVEVKRDFPSISEDIPILIETNDNDVIKLAENFAHFAQDSNTTIVTIIIDDKKIEIDKEYQASIKIDFPEENNLTSDRTTYNLTIVRIEDPLNYNWVPAGNGIYYSSFTGEQFKVQFEMAEGYENGYYCRVAPYKEGYYIPFYLDENENIIGCPAGNYDMGVTYASAALIFHYDPAGSFGSYCYTQNEGDVYTIAGVWNTAEGLYVAKEQFMWTEGGPTETAISKIFDDEDALIELSNKDNIYYDLSGRRVENPTRGIYIMNGKKVFVK